MGRIRFALGLVVQRGPHPGGYLGAEQLDGLEHLGVRHAADVHLQEVAAVAKMVMQVDDALGDLLRVAGEDHAAGGVVRERLAPGARGKAAEGIAIDLFREGTLIKQAVTNQDGRTDDPLLSGEPLRIGRYELRFNVETYYAGWPNVTDPPWYDIIPIRFAVSEPEGHYHIPLLLNAWTYSTYRGS